jgi:4-amino-4-deoxy-L-arabinose transferase-like glycosyltransferase
LRHAGALLLLLVISLPALTYRLSTCPPPWLDEGPRTNTARTLAERGVYATGGVAGAHPFDPMTSSGPVDLLAVAAAFRLAGTGTAQARAPMVLFTLVAVALLYLLAQWLWGWHAGLVAVLAALAMPRIHDTSLLFLGRQVMSEAPSLALTLLGLWLLFQSWQRQRDWMAVVAGMLTALALYSKGQTTVGLLPAILVGCLLRWRAPGGRLAPLLAWSAGMAIAVTAMLTWQFLSTTEAVRQEHVATFIDQLHAQLAMTDPARRLPRSAARIAAIVALAVSLRAAALAPWRGSADGDPSRRCAELTLVGYVLFAGLWYLLVSVGWPRYAYSALVFSGLLLGRSVYGVLPWAVERLRRWPAVAGRAYGLVVAGLALAALSSNLEPLRRCPAHSDAEDVGAYIRASIPPPAVIESFDWEVDALSSHWNYHHPPQSYLTESIRQMAVGEAFDLRYDVLQADPDYLLTGPFSDWVRIYDSDVTRKNFRRVASFGPYAVLERVR